MKVKTSITLSKALLKEIDSMIGKDSTRSAFIEYAVKEHISLRKMSLRDRKDLYRINQSADELNREAEDVLSYQADY